jgi:transposase
MKTIGIDLGVKGEHKAIVADERGHFVSPILHFHTDPEALKRVLEEARGNPPEQELQVVMEPTGMAWFPVAAYLIRCKVTVYLVNSQQVADLRKYYKKHAKSDRVDARVLAKLPVVGAEKLHCLELAGAVSLSCQRGCKELEHLVQLCTATKNRIVDLDRFAWPGLEEAVFEDHFSQKANWFREHWYNPARVIQAGVEYIQQAWQKSDIDPEDPGDWVAALMNCARKGLDLYGSEVAFMDFDLLQAEANRQQALLNFLEEQHHTILLNVVHRQYRKLHPSRNLETIKGVGQDGAAVFASFIGNPMRFASLSQHRSWSGMVPNSKQSSTSESSGLKITQAGPRLIKKFAYLDAEVARQYDPQIAAIYYDQMVNKGKHHTQAICTCATHLLDRILVILREDRPFILQDVDGTPVNNKQARQIIADRYQVPDEVRRRNNKRAQKERLYQQSENRQVRES